jgi:hypothetical protein
MRSKRDLPTSPSRRLLATIPGQYLVDAMDLLPPCEAGSTNQQLIIEIPFEGKFCVTFSPCKQTLHGWGTQLFWLPRCAVPL